MRDSLTTIAFAADDTLWHNERFFAHLLGPCADRDTLMAQLLETKRRNLPHYGFGIKGFTLSMIENAFEVTRAKSPQKSLLKSCMPGRACCPMR